MRVDVEWKELKPRSKRWHATRCLYAYLDPHDDRILYLGKADGTTIRQRFTAPDKEHLLDFFEDGYGLSGVTVMIGEIRMGERLRLTRELLADIESLLISRIKPPGNVQSTRSRIARPGLLVRCLGDWPHKKARFRDRG